MQKERTVQFWDEFYESKTATEEWIVQPSPELLATIASHIPEGGQVLEIGCGNSGFARELAIYLQNDRKHSCSILATDVSAAGIAQCRQRDAGVPNLDYQVLNVLESQVDFEGRFDVVLDKGCLDTFLFRSRQRGADAQHGGPLVATVLNHVHTWLKVDGVYLVLSPRLKLKALRDFAGMEHGRQRIRAPVASLVGDHEEKVQLHVCRKNNHYTPFQDDPFPKEVEPKDDDACPGCGIVFGEFRTNVVAVHCVREWRGHCRHCRG